MWCTLKLFTRLKCESKMNIMKEWKVGVHSLVCNISRVEGHDGVSKKGLKRMISKSITHTNLHKPNTSWLVHSWSTFGARTSHGQTRTHKTHHNLNLGEATTFPLILFSMPSHGASTQMSFAPKLPSWSPKIPKIGTSTTLGAHNFFCKPLIEMTFEVKL
jgi:hypothetical protein